jgi:hypothetical protein
MNITYVYSDKELLAKIDDIKGNIEHLQTENARKNNLIRKYESKDYENERIKELMEENKELKQKLLNAKCRNMFALTEEEDKSVKKWQKAHNAEKHPDNYFGAIGGELTYSFVPTSLGVIGTVTCTCGEEFTFRDID